MSRRKLYVPAGRPTQPRRPRPGATSPTATSPTATSPTATSPTATTSHTVATRSRPDVVTAIKAVHTLAWASIEFCVLYVLAAGLAGRTDRRVGLAASVVGGETLVFAANGFACPLTELAERYGADRGSVTDIWLPGWFARSLPAIHAPLLVLMTYLHARNLRRPRPGPGYLRRP